MRTIIFSLLILSSVATNAQSSDSQKLLNLATTEFNQLRYSYAIPLLKEYIKINANSAQALGLLANSYKINNQYDSAIKYFELAKAAGTDVSNALAEVYASKGDYEHAINSYSATPKSPLSDARVYGFKNTQSFKNDSLDFNVQYLKINTPFNEYAVVPLNDGIVFESNRAQKIKGSNEFGWDGSSFSALYFTNNVETNSDSIATVKWVEKTKTMAFSDLSVQTFNDNATASKKYDFKSVAFDNNGVAYFDEALNTKFNAGAICFTADGNTAYFTRNQNKSKGVYLLEIWSAKKVQGKWSNLTKLSFNNDKASYSHPAISNDEKRLYFISDQEGGVGGTDLYFADVDSSGNWSSPINAGEKVNTVANELYPAVAEGQLYISSNGHAGLGGLDIYKVKMMNGIITSIENIGYPLNSAGDDMSLSKNGKKGFFTSNRYGTDDIFSYEYELAYITISGKVLLSNQATGPITVNLYEVNAAGVVSAPIQSMVAANGDYAFKVRPNRVYKIEAIEPGGNKNAATINSNNYISKGAGVFAKSLSTLVINIPPPPPPVETRKTFNNIIDSLKALTTDYVVLHHDFDKVTLEKSHNKIYKELLARIRKIKGARIVVVSAADCKGTDEYNEKLSARRAAFISKQVASVSKKNQVVSLHVGEKILAEPCEESANKDKQLENRYTYVFLQK